MKVKNIMFSGFAAAILMGVGAANAVVSDATYNLANTGYVDAKVGQAEAAAKKHFDDKYNSTEKLTDLLNAKEDVANKATKSEVSVGLYDGDGKVVESAMSALEANDTDFPTVGATVEIANAKAKQVITKVNQAADDISNLQTAVEKLNKGVNDEGSVAHTAAAQITAALKDAQGNDVYATAAELNQYKQEVAGAGYITMDAVTAENYVTAEGAKAAVATEGYLKSGDLTGYAKTAELNAASVGETGKFIVTVSEADGIVSATAESFADAVTADGAVAPTAKAVNDFVTGKGYAVAETVNAELAKKLQLTEGLTAGTYLVTVGETGAVTYTAISVATAADATAQQGA